MLQFQLLPIRDWNVTVALKVLEIAAALQFQLLPIRDWNKHSSKGIFWGIMLQFQLLPIRDWNSLNRNIDSANGCYNFSYSLLGIETEPPKVLSIDFLVTISVTPY